MKKIILILCAFCTVSAFAQTTTDEQAAQIAKLTEEVNQLKADSQKWDKVISSLPKISGYVMGRYTYADDQSTFRLRRVRMSVAGEIGKKIDYKFQAELSSFKLLDAYFNYKPFESFKVKAGQFKVPFTVENTDYTPTKMILMDHPMVLDRLVGSSEQIGDTTLKSTGRELGIDLHGSLLNKVLHYDLAIFNGAGLNTTDNNKSKDVVGRLKVTPCKGLTLSGSYYWGEYDDTFFTRERWSFGGVYDKDAVLVRAEYVGGKTGFEDAELESDGWYVLGGYRFADGKWQVAARYDSFTENTELRDDTTQSNITVGVAWKPIKNIRLQGNFVCEDHAVGGNRNVAMLQVTASF